MRFVHSPLKGMQSMKLQKSASTHVLLAVVQLTVLFACTAVMVFPPCASNFRERFCPTTLSRPPRQSAKDSGIWGGKGGGKEMG